MTFPAKMSASYRAFLRSSSGFSPNIQVAAAFCCIRRLHFFLNALSEKELHFAEVFLLSESIDGLMLRRFLSNIQYYFLIRFYNFCA